MCQVFQREKNKSRNDITSKNAEGLWFKNM